MKAINLYDKDFYAWTKKQEELLINNELDKLDLQHIAQEIHIMGASELRELDNRLIILLMHLLKWQYQPNLRSRSWELTIKEQRRALIKHLSKMPSLKAKLPDLFLEAYEDAILKAEQETGLDESVFPKKCEWVMEKVLDFNFYPQ